MIMTSNKCVLIVFGISIALYTMFHLVNQGHIMKINMLEKELAVVLEVVSDKERVPRENRPQPGMSQLELVKFKIETLRNEMDQIRDFSFQRANFALESNGAAIVTVYDMEMQWNFCFIKAVFGKPCDYSNGPRHLIRVLTTSLTQSNISKVNNFKSHHFRRENPILESAGYLMHFPERS